ncbi:AAA family ATPase [Rhizobiaceae bacterium CRRU44]|uniref:AAA family ATPase n=1 Tax=Ferranicluibacter rubi TaxID=2715133 RepID=A0AA43ZJW4_9HYPH|nr:AAA family ATPase [Ferranicluibacter rubi]NHT77776.1 AAA family ATPase [Ferranicluibacter rubi]
MVPKMQLIKKIEINYLRSLYQATLVNVGDLNVIFGRNDSGKSNVLRALNLFFNDRIDPYTDLDFELDVSDVRPGQAKKTKSRLAIWIKITFNVPPNYQKSLGEEITVRRQWNRDATMTERVWPPDLSSGQLAQVTKLMNRIDFTYIPGIKDNTIYADLIERMYVAAAATSELQQATDNFIAAIQGQTLALSSKLSSLFQSPSRLAAPTEMSSLFRTLDFAHGEEGHSLLRQKGDGIKARHLPELLRFINENESGAKIFIWGFEEPENSLDLGAADAESKRFSDFAARPDTQIFITSHSPAFYLAEIADPASRTSRYFVSKQRLDFNETEMQPADAVSSINDLAVAETKMEEAGLMQLPFVIRQLSEMREEREIIEIEREALESKLRKLERPTVFVEGKHDVQLYAAAMQRAGLAATEYRIRSLGGTPKSGQILKMIFADGEKVGGVPTFFLFDNDRAGRKSYQDMMSAKPASSPVSFNRDINVWLLPLSEEFKGFLTEHNISEDQAFFTAEFLYPAKAGAKLCQELVERHSKGVKKAEYEDWRTTIHGDYFKSIGQRRALELVLRPEGGKDWFFSRGVPASLKVAFADGAVERKLNTNAIDSVAKTIARHLGINRP